MMCRKLPSFGPWWRCVHTVIIPNHTERAELISGLKIFVCAHLRLRINQRSQGGVDRPKLACSGFRGTPNSGISVRPPSGLVLVVPGAVASFLFRASTCTISISNLGLYEHQTPLPAHSTRVTRGAPTSGPICPPPAPFFPEDAAAQIRPHFGSMHPPPCARWPGTLGSWLAGHCPWVLVPLDGRLLLARRGRVYV